MLRCRFEARTVKREWGLGLEKREKVREGLRGERRGQEEWKRRRRRFETCGIVCFQFIGLFVIIGKGFSV